MFLPSVGIVYKFTFLPDYTDLDGVYHVAQILTLQEALASGINLVNNFYSKVGKTKDDFIADQALIVDSKIIKLLDPDSLDELTPIYAPMYYLATQPNHNIKKYHKLAVAINLGIFDNPSNLSFIIDNLTNMFTACLGITTVPDVFSINSEYKTIEEYGAIETERVNNKTGVTNYYTEILRLEKELTEARAKLAAYEEILINNVQPTTTP